LLFFAHFIDASATFISIDQPFGIGGQLNYTEKHVIPHILISLFHTAAVMFILKLIIIIFVIYVIDIALKSELAPNPRLTGLIKLCILVLGLAPGTRDMLRLVMCV
jgi:uncharacterized membrane protein